MRTKRAKLLGCTRDGNKIVKVDGIRGVPSHLKSLYVPPAWTDVLVNPDPNAKLMATGLDVAGRQQRLYSSTHKELASAKKFRKVRRLLEVRDDIREQIECDATHPDSVWGEEAAVAALIYATGVRPGSDRDTKAAKKAYGATTLQARHVRVTDAGTVFLTFPGKKGVVNHIRVDDAKVAKDLVRRKRLAGSAYTTELFATSDAEVRNYMDALTDGEFTPKDLRSMRANLLAEELVKGLRVPKAKTKAKKVVREIIKKVADRMGHTPAVCKSAYLDPKLFERFAVN